MHDNNRTDSQASDPVIVIGPGDITETGDTETGDPAPGWEDAGHWHRAVPAPAEQEPDTEPEPEAERSPEPSPSRAAPLGSRWREIQSGFVDDPRGSVTEAAALADEEVDAWSDRIARLQKTMRAHWQADADPSTEDLRIALTAYRDLCLRLREAAETLT